MISPARHALQIAPWLVWSAGSVVLIFDPAFGPLLFSAGALWLYATLIFAPRPQAGEAMRFRLIALGVVAAPAVLIAAYRIPFMTDVAVIFVPFYLAPAIGSLILSLAGVAITLLRRPARRD